MSRIGKLPVQVPSGVTASLSGSSFSVKGPKGEMSLSVRPEVAVEVGDGVVTVSKLGQEGDRLAQALFGTTRALIQNMVIGVTDGYQRKLEINGVGYGAEIQGQNIQLNLGFSHPVTLPIPSTVSVECPNQTTVLISGCDKQQVGQFAAKVRKLRPPEPYKGKGIKYDDEVIRRKAGKAFGAA